MGFNNKMRFMTEIKNRTDIESQNKLVEIIQRTKVQNEVLEKLLKAIRMKESETKRLKVK